MFRLSVRALSGISSGLARRPFSSTPVLQSLRPIGPKSQIPEFKGTAVVDGDFKVLSSKEFKGKWLVFFFYPLDFTFVCPTEIIAFSDRNDDFKKQGAQVVACSCDSQFSHLAWIQTPRKEGGLGELKIPVLSDFNKKISESFGVLDAQHLIRPPTIMTYGPVEASFIVYEDFMQPSKGVYASIPLELGRTPQAVKIIGWGDKGFFRINRGVEECEIERAVVVGIPDF